MATAGNTKDRILDVAETLFADNGFAATSLRDITREAGVNIAAVNYHFGSKDGLLGAVLERRIAHGEQAAPRATRPGGVGGGERRC